MRNDSILVATLIVRTTICGILKNNMCLLSLLYIRKKVGEWYAVYRCQISGLMFFFQDTECRSIPKVFFFYQFIVPLEAMSTVAGSSKTVQPAMLQHLLWKYFRNFLARDKFPLDYFHQGLVIRLDFFFFLWGYLKNQVCSSNPHTIWVVEKNYSCFSTTQLFSQQLYQWNKWSNAAKCIEMYK